MGLTSTNILILGSAGVLALAGCSGSTKATATPSPSVSTVVVTTQPPTTTSAAAPAPASSSAAPAPTGCAPAGNGVPAGATSGPTVDVDGDGKADTEWIEKPASDGSVTVGVTTASGATFSAKYSSASPISRNLFIAYPTGSRPAVAIVSDGRQATLYTLEGCAFTGVSNPTGQTFVFDLGFSGNGTGVGCSTVAGQGGQSLVGLNVVSDANGKATSISRTAVVVNGTQASIGREDTVPADDAAAASARTISCGNLSLAANSVHTSQ